jgi:cytochrome P450
MRRLVHQLVAERRRSAAQAHDLCGQLMQARDPETGRPLGDEDLVDMLLTLIAAGHETTANGLCWAIWCLAGAPELQAALALEVNEVVGSGPIEPDLLPRLSLTKAFLMETMRLFPPAPLLARRTVKPETLGGHDLPTGTTLFIPIYAIHRHERLWPDPHRFDLSRFLDGRDRQIARTAYLPLRRGAKDLHRCQLRHDGNDGGARDAASICPFQDGRRLWGQSEPAHHAATRGRFVSLGRHCD